MDSPLFFPHFEHTWAAEVPYYVITGLNWCMNHPGTDMSSLNKRENPITSTSITFITHNMSQCKFPRNKEYMSSITQEVPASSNHQTLLMLSTLTQIRAGFDTPSSSMRISTSSARHTHTHLHQPTYPKPQQLWLEAQNNCLKMFSFFFSPVCSITLHQAEECEGLAFTWQKQDLWNYATDR